LAKGIPAADIHWKTVERFFRLLSLLPGLAEERLDVGPQLAPGGLLLGWPARERGFLAHAGKVGGGLPTMEDFLNSSPVGRLTAARPFSVSILVH
jgi:hypothetical protein